MQCQGLNSTARAPQGWKSEKKVVLVTGGNRGIGKAICQKLLSSHPDVHVVLSSRDLERGKHAASDILKSNTHFRSRLTVVQLDVTSDASLKSASKLVSELGQLCGIVNNAAVSPCTGMSCMDILDTNYFGPRRVNDEFSPLLVKPGGRIVNVSSVGAPTYLSGCLFFFEITGLRAEVHKKLSHPLCIKGGLTELDGIALETTSRLCNYSLGTFLGAPLLRPKDHAYQLSKALLNAYTVLQAKAEPELIINGCCTGFIDTDLVPKRLGFTQSPEEGALPPVELLLSNAFASESDGKFYVEGKSRNLSEIPDLKNCPDSFKVLFEKFLPLQDNQKMRHAATATGSWVTMVTMVTMAVVSLAVAAAQAWSHCTS